MVRHGIWVSAALCAACASPAVGTTEEELVLGSTVFIGNCQEGEVAAIADGRQFPVITGTYCTGGLAFDRAGNLLIASAQPAALLVREPSGRMSVRSQGDFLGDFGDDVPSLALDPRSGTAYLASNSSNDVVAVDPGGGQTVMTVAGARNISGLGIDYLGRLLVSSHDANTVFRVTAGRTAWLAKIPSPLGITISETGLIYVGSETGDIYAIDLAGRVSLWSRAAPGNLAVTAQWLAAEHGDLYVTGVNGNIVKIDHHGVRSVFSGGAAIAATSGLAICHGVGCGVGDVAFETAHQNLMPPIFGWGKDPNNWVLGSIRGGDAVKGSDPNDQAPIDEIALFQPIAADNPYWLEKWTNNVAGIARAELAARYANRDGGTARVAEMRFLRGFYTLELVKNFGAKLPTFDEDGCAHKSKANPLAVIEGDWRYAAAHLPAVTGNAGDLNAWAAKAFLGKLLVYEGRFAEAKAVFDDVIAHGTTATGQRYALQAHFEWNFDASHNNSAESIFAQQARLDGYTNHLANPGYTLAFPYAPGVCCGFFQPSQTLVDAFQVDGDGLPFIDPKHGTFPFSQGEVKSDMGITSGTDFTPTDAALDARLDWTVGRRGIPYLDWGLHPGNDWIRDQEADGPYSPIKNVSRIADLSSSPLRAGFYDGWADGTAINYNFMRYADLLLLAAETEVELGNLETARGYVNQVRNRAGVSQVKLASGDAAARYQVGAYAAFADQAFAREAVRTERRLELAMEGHRFYDLVRWGSDYAETELNQGYLQHQAKTLPQFQDTKFDYAANAFLPLPDQLDACQQ